MYTMAIKCTRKCYKSIKILLSIVVFIFFIQLYIVFKYFPPENNLLPEREKLNNYNSEHNIYRRKDDSEVSARKFKDINSDDEDLLSKNLNNKLLHETKSNNLKHNLFFNKDELDFTPICHVVSKEAISAIHRAKTQRCKEIIVNTTCLVQSGSFYAEKLPNSCASGGLVTGKQLGCYHDEKKLRLLSSHYGNYRNMNSPEHCIDICLQAGFPYAGVQYASECFCGEDVPSTTQKIADTSCNMKCPGNPKELCGGYFTMNVYETGVSKFNANVPNLIPENSSDSVRIVFLLTLNGRALRQVRRLINALYHTKHYFYIHVDARQDYLHRELLPLQEQFSNVKIAHKRFSTIWGGASLLEMLLSAMRNLFALQWKWDFVINLSESDFPIKPLKQLETFLTANKGRNFVKSHGREVQRFIKKQGLDKTFIECDAHMWRIGDRKLPRGIVIDGGSDWIALSPDFVSYVVGEQDELLVGLHTIFKHTLLPAESFFHTVLRNSMFCSSYVDNNLHVTNWKRKLGCKCQYKHVVDWCGCSPNDFRLDDWSRIQSTRDRQLFFARKFEPVINQAIIARVEQWLGFDDHYDLPNSEAYWQSIYHKNDSNPPVDDALLTHTTSITRLNAKILTQERCKIVPGEVIEISSYHYEDMYKGNLIKHNVEVHGYERVLIETWYKPKRHLELNRYSRFYDNIKIFLVSSDYDQKEQTFRNFANILGPLSEPSVLYQFILTPDQTTVTNNFTIFWLDPADNIAEINDLQIDDSNLTSYIKPNLQTPLLPGIWKVAMFNSGMLVAQTKFLITPLQYLSGNMIVDHEITFVNAGSMSSYKDYSTRYRDITDLTKSESHRESARMLVQSNMKRFGSDLVEWIDNLVHQFYDVLGSCVHYENEELYNTVLSCGRHNFEICKLTKWSSFAPDPKGHIGELNKVTGLLDRR